MEKCFSHSIYYSILSNNCNRFDLPHIFISASLAIIDYVTCYKVLVENYELDKQSNGFS